MFHTYKHNGSDKTLVLFHGTGGDENSLIHLAQKAAPHMNHLALRGDVVSHGQRRFAKVKDSNDILDWEDMLQRVPQIQKIIKTLKVRYKLNELWALGFSNGANAIASILLDGEPMFEKAILLRPMEPQIKTKENHLNNMEILIHSGINDHVIPYKYAIDLETHLINNGGNVTHKSYDLDHRMRAFEIQDLKEWFDKHK